MWPSESNPAPEVVAIFEVVEREFALEKPDLDTIEAELAKLNFRELLPSQEMRRTYLLGRLISDRRRYVDASEFYVRSFEVAEAGHDLASQVWLAMHAGLMAYGSQQNELAVKWYSDALDRWQVYEQQLEKPCITTEAMIQRYLADPLWLLGRFDEAHAAVARAVALAFFRSRVTRGAYMEELGASALWTLALVLRSQSDQRDGDAELIRQALRRAKKAAKLYRRLHPADVNLARFYVQVAELYLDLTELHLQRASGVSPAARAMYREALNHLSVAFHYARKANNSMAELLARVTQARAMVMCMHGLAPWVMSDIEAALQRIERHKAAEKDSVLLAKAATVRAEWMLNREDLNQASEFARRAIEGFGEQGRGMATRAERLLRRIG